MYCYEIDVHIINGKDLEKIRFFNINKIIKRSKKISHVNF